MHLRGFSWSFAILKAVEIVRVM